MPKWKRVTVLLNSEDEDYWLEQGWEPFAVHNEIQNASEWSNRNHCHEPTGYTENTTYISYRKLVE